MSEARILIVDDDPDMASVLGQLLESSGYKVSAVMDGEAALQFLEKSFPDLVVADVMLPKMDGWKLCKKIKEDERTRAIPVLIVTGKSEEMDEIMSYESGADGFIRKPFKNDEFVAAVENLLNGTSRKP